MLNDLAILITMGRKLPYTFYAFLLIVPLWVEGNNIIQFGRDGYIGPDEEVESVVSIGGVLEAIYDWRKRQNITPQIKGA